MQPLALPRPIPGDYDRCTLCGGNLQDRRARGCLGGAASEETEPAFGLLDMTISFGQKLFFARFATED
jgi:hypothetical protein